MNSATRPQSSAKRAALNFAPERTQPETWTPLFNVCEKWPTQSR